MQLPSHNRRPSNYIVGGNHDNQQAWNCQKNREQRGGGGAKNNRLSVSVKGRSLGDVMKETAPYGLAKAVLHRTHNNGHDTNSHRRYLSKMLCMQISKLNSPQD